MARVKAQRVVAIENRGDIDALRAYFKNNFENGEMYALLVTMGVNFGLRAGDLRLLKIGNFRKGTHLVVEEKKTKKIRRMYINEKVREELRRYEESTKKVYFDGHGFFKGNKLTPIEVKHIHKIIKQGCGAIGLEGNYGSHTLRKTFAYHAFQLVPNLKVLQGVFGHSDVFVTRMYLGEECFEDNDYGVYEMDSDGSERERMKSAMDYIYANLNL